MRLLEDSKVAEDVPQDDEDNDAHAAAAARQFPGSVTSGNPTQQLAHRYSVIKVKSCALQSHDSYRVSGGSGDEGFQRYWCRITLRPQAGPGSSVGRAAD